MQITGTHFNYYQVCHRKLWLFANGLQMESTSDLVTEGRLIHEYSYKRRSDKFQEIAIDGIKIDYFDAKNKVVHEIKKSNKHEDAHEWQLKYYLYVLKKHAYDGCIGLLEYPKLRKTEEIHLYAEDEKRITEMIKDISRIIKADDCPGKLPLKRCRNCSYFDFCHVGGGD